MHAQNSSFSESDRTSWAFLECLLFLGARETFGRRRINGLWTVVFLEDAVAVRVEEDEGGYGVESQVRFPLSFDFVMRRARVRVGEERKR